MSIVTLVACPSPPGGDGVTYGKPSRKQRQYVRVPAFFPFVHPAPLQAAALVVPNEPAARHVSHVQVVVVVVAPRSPRDARDAGVSIAPCSGYRQPAGVGGSGDTGSPLRLHACGLPQRRSQRRPRQCRALGIRIPSTQGKSSLMGDDIGS